MRIDTMSHQGLTTNADPVTYFGRAGIKPEEVLQDAKDIYAKVPRGKGLGVHVLTGPIYIEGAEPGDALEVRVRAVMAVTDKIAAIASAPDPNAKLAQVRPKPTSARSGTMKPIGRRGPTCPQSKYFVKISQRRAPD